MSRDAKFGYGFLFLGSALPYLIEKLFGSPLTAAIVTAIFLVIGIAFLVAAHRHGQSLIAHRGLRGKVGIVLLTVVLMASVITGIVWAIMRNMHTHEEPKIAEKPRPPVELPHPESPKPEPPRIEQPNPKPKPHPKKRPEQPRETPSAPVAPIIQLPSIGNLKERAIDLSNEIMWECLTRRGWRKWQTDPNNHNPFILTMPEDKEGMLKWNISASNRFRARYLKRVADIRKEFADLHLRDEQLDQSFEGIESLDIERQQIGHKTGNPFMDDGLILPVEIEQIAERLKVLAAQVRPPTN